MELYTWQNYPPEKLLKDRFHITTGFHPDQRSIIERLVQGQRVLAIQRTGWGKSLCYQMASLYQPYLTIVFSPLMALMRDQWQRCTNVYNIPSAIVSSEFTQEENRQTLERAVAGELKILFIAPERLDNIDWQGYVVHMRISMIVIDEAHCISTWGHDFRPHYRRIVRLLNTLPEKTPVLALTATANKRVENDILQQMHTAQIVRGTMQRPNLMLDVFHVNGESQKLGYLAEILPGLSGTGVIYTATKRNAEMISAFLQRQNMSAIYYHAGIENNERRSIEQQWMQNGYKVVCSTNALGMGIDKPDIRFVIHYDVPGSPIHYYQEIGRAGRDGLQSRCILLYDPEDMRIQEHFIASAKPEGQQYVNVLNFIRRAFNGGREIDILRATGLPQQAVRKILMDLVEQHLIERDERTKAYTAISQSKQVDFSAYDKVAQQKREELSDIQNYTASGHCYAGFLTAYLGDPSGYICGVCGYCRPDNFPQIVASQRIQQAVTQFLEKDFLPRIQKRSSQRNPGHEAGFSLSYHGNNRIGELVRHSKYENGGPFPVELVTRAVEVVRMHYPMQAIDGIVSIPPTKSGSLVENLARRIASGLGIKYLPVVLKVGLRGEQKSFTNSVQKKDNVKDAFAISSPELIRGQTLLLIDDIYDSGYTMLEVARTLMKEHAKAVYPFTITRTLHSDDQ